MPNYQHHCSKCQKYKEFNYSMSFIGKESELPEEIKKEITCKHYEIWPRVPFAPHIANQKGGTTVTQKELLKDKQAYAKKRSALHTKNEGYKDIKDPEMKKKIYDKYHKGPLKDMKGDHEKMKF